MNNENESDFFSAVKCGDVNRAASLLASVDVNRVDAERGESALLVAAEHGHASLVAMLIDAGADIDGVSGAADETACHGAARHGHVAVVELLVARGANLALENRNCFTALWPALYGRHERTALTLIAAGAPLLDDDRLALCNAAATGTGVIAVLLERHFSAGDLCDDDGSTPCHAVAWNPCADVCGVIDMLVNVVGVDIDARGPGGVTCLFEAIDFRNTVAVRRFVELGADVNRSDDGGVSPLHCQCSKPDDSCLLLLAAGADVGARTTASGRTPCHVAAEAGSAVLVHELLAAGADFDAPDAAGETPRQIAARTGVLEPTTDELAAARRRVARARIDFVRERALQVCIGLQPLGLDALQMCAVLRHACGPRALLVPFHSWWEIATTVKHFKSLLGSK